MKRRDLPRLFVVYNCEVLLGEAGNGFSGFIGYHHIERDGAIRTGKRRGCRALGQSSGSIRLCKYGNERQAEQSDPTALPFTHAIYLRLAFQPRL
jgi:hypothetical protein